MNHCVHLCSFFLTTLVEAVSQLYLCTCLIVQCLEAEMKETKAIGQSVRQLGMFSQNTVNSLDSGLLDCNGLTAQLNVRIAKAESYGLSW